MPGVGMKVASYDDEGNSIMNAKGELVCSQAFPSMPIYFWNDPNGKKYQSAYFDTFPNTWHHGDYIEINDHGGIKIYSIDSMEEISWISHGFSVRDIYWEPLSEKLILSCGFQGVVVFTLDNNMGIQDSWILTTSYAYAARDYNKHILVCTRNGIEILINNETTNSVNENPL